MRVCMVYELRSLYGCLVLVMGGYGWGYMRAACLLGKGYLGVFAQGSVRDKEYCLGPIGL